MKVVFTTPATFGREGYVGGGERYAIDLARAMAARVSTKLVAIGPARRSSVDGALRIEVYPPISRLSPSPFDPFSLSFLRSLTDADIIHCHSYGIRMSAAAVLFGRLLRKPVFLTDHGATSDRRPGRRVTDSCSSVDAYLTVSEFSGSLLPGRPPHIPIYGGANQSIFHVRGLPREADLVAYVGRLLPHKGVDVLIRALPDEARLEICGSAYSEQYLQYLRRLAAGRRVKFTMGADDVEVANLLARAQVSVTPSVYRDAMGVTHRAPELLGLACIEAMSCATPVIVSDVGGLTEIVHHRVEGLVVPWGDVSALHAAITRMVANPAAARAMGERGLEAVRTKLNWHATADRCLQAYAGSAPH